MSILSRNALKSEFISGTAATESKFEDIFDSTYNLNDDSLLFGPVGITGAYGLLGPTGGTYLGLWVSSGSTPGSSASIGTTGQVVFEISGPTANMYVYIGSRWIKFAGTSNF